MLTQERMRELLSEEILKTPKGATYAMLSSHDAFSGAALSAMTRAVQEAVEEAAKVADGLLVLGDPPDYQQGLIDAATAIRSLAPRD